MSLFSQPSRSSSSQVPSRSSPSQVPSLFEQVLQNHVNPINVTQSGSSGSSGSSGRYLSNDGGSFNNVLSGGNGEMIKLEELFVYIFLLHGEIGTDKQSVSSVNLDRVPYVDISGLDKIKNLACISAAPAGIINIGVINTLDITQQFIRDEILSKKFEKKIKEELTKDIQEIENKAREITGTDKKGRIKYKAGFFHRICNFCFKIIPSDDQVNSFVGKVYTGMVEGLVGQILGFSQRLQQGSIQLNICKSVSSYGLQGGGTKRKRSSGLLQREVENKNPLCEVSIDLLVLMLDGLREQLKQHDIQRFPKICQTAYLHPHVADDVKESCKIAETWTHERFRNLSILKGFGVTSEVRYVNKRLVYNDYNDSSLKMGVVELSFELDEYNKVICKTRKVEPLVLIDGIKTKNGNITSISNQDDPTDLRKVTYSFTMQDCITYMHDAENPTPISNQTSTSTSTPNRTVLLVDLSCSGYSGGVADTPYARDSQTRYPGGGGGGGVYLGKQSNTRSKMKPKTKSYTKSKTRKIAKSANSKYKRNRRRYTKQSQ